MILFVANPKLFNIFFKTLRLIRSYYPTLETKKKFIILRENFLRYSSRLRSSDTFYYKYLFYLFLIMKFIVFFKIIF